MTLDTNILIAYFNGDEKVIEIVSEWKKSGKTVYISSIAFAETLAYPAVTPSDVKIIRDFVNQSFSVPFNNEVGEIAALLRRKYQLKLPDAGIAATSILYHSPLVTRDRQFQKIQEITVVVI